MAGDSVKDAIQRTHISHSLALADAHRRLKIPENSIGTTLSPRQIIELRGLRQRQKPADPMVHLSNFEFIHWMCSHAFFCRRLLLLTHRDSERHML